MALLVVGLVLAVGGGEEVLEYICAYPLILWCCRWSSVKVAIFWLPWRSMSGLEYWGRGLME